MWARRVAYEYYGKETDTSLGDMPSQEQLHIGLLQAVRAHVQADGQPNNSSHMSPLDEYIASVAGWPLMYGICLQHQHLDCVHFPKPLDVKNARRPFLYRYIECNSII